MCNVGDVRDVSGARGFRVPVQVQLDYFSIDIYLPTRLVNLNFGALIFPYWDARCPMPPLNTL